MRNAILALAAIAISCASPLGAKAEPVNRVIELFTSQGCNSCPPADRLAGELARVPGTVVISLPVDYWDYLGWKDSFASPAFTARQKAYSKARGDMQVYTPQVVVDGVAHAVGSERDAIDDIAAASPTPKVPISETVDGDHVRIEVATSEASAKGAKVWLVPILSSASVAIGRGENAGETVTYTNVARELRSLGDWNGVSRKFDVSIADIRKLGADGVAILLQSDAGGLPGPILGAALAKLN
jgi:hypothetical protein